MLVKIEIEKKRNNIKKRERKRKKERKKERKRERQWEKGTYIRRCV